MFLNENFNYAITNSRFAIRPGHAASPSPSRQIARISNNRPLSKILSVWETGPSMPDFVGTTINCLLNQNAVDPRLSLARYFPSADLVLHFSYDRVFQTPSFENILLSSSPAATNP